MRGIREPVDPGACKGKPWCEVQRSIAPKPPGYMVPKKALRCTCDRRARWPYDRRHEDDDTVRNGTRRGPEDRRSMRGLDTDLVRDIHPRPHRPPTFLEATLLALASAGVMWLALWLGFA